MAAALGDTPGIGIGIGEDTLTCAPCGSVCVYGSIVSLLPELGTHLLLLLLLLSSSSVGLGSQQAPPVMELARFEAHPPATVQSCSSAAGWTAQRIRRRGQQEQDDEDHVESRALLG